MKQLKRGVGRALRPRVIRMTMGLIGLLAMAKGGMALTSCNDAPYGGCYFNRAYRRWCCIDYQQFSCWVSEYIHSQTGAAYWSGRSSCYSSNYSCTPYWKSCPP